MGLLVCINLVSIAARDQELQLKPALIKTNTTSGGVPEGLAKGGEYYHDDDDDDDDGGGGAADAAGGDGGGSSGPPIISAATSASIAPVTTLRSFGYGTSGASSYSIALVTAGSTTLDGNGNGNGNTSNSIGIIAGPDQDCDWLFENNELNMDVAIGDYDDGDCLGGATSASAPTSASTATASTCGTGTALSSDQAWARVEEQHPDSEGNADLEFSYGDPYV
jgi:hypothetical protein